jgi:hypothetical protein
MIDVSTLSPGLYVIEVLFEGKKETAGFVKQ